MRTAQEYINRHEGQREERLAHSSSKKDIILGYFIRIRRVSGGSETGLKSAWIRKKRESCGGWKEMFQTDIMICCKVLKVLYCTLLQVKLVKGTISLMINV